MEDQISLRVALSFSLHPTNKESHFDYTITHLETSRTFKSNRVIKEWESFPGGNQLEYKSRILEALQNAGMETDKMGEVKATLKIAETSFVAYNKDTLPPAYQTATIALEKDLNAMKKLELTAVFMNKKIGKIDFPQ
ncbi:hypothetical protein HOD38_04840 [archaeon]|jgi:hypothetical protein|nr:hypothetical protein [archaeon]MBT4397567.1 hypothetical protein [archaeon]MBT4440822.1 hypothetical protein [archaeon]